MHPGHRLARGDGSPGATEASDREDASATSPAPAVIVPSGGPLPFEFFPLFVALVGIAAVLLFMENLSAIARLRPPSGSVDWVCD
jgi:hypothetical protein